MTLAIYPGSFDPVTKGHINILEKAARLFDKVIIAVSVNYSKHAVFSFEERLNLIKQSIGDGFKNVEVDMYEGLTIKYAQKVGANAIIRGIRRLNDFEYESQMSKTNKSLDENIETVFLLPDGEFDFISSSMVREIAKLGGDVTKLVTPPVNESLMEYKNRGEL